MDWKNVTLGELAEGLREVNKSVLIMEPRSAWVDVVHAAHSPCML